MSEANANSPADPGGGGTPDPAPAANNAPAEGVGGSPAQAPAFDRDGWRSQYKSWADGLEDPSHKDMASRFTGPEDLLKLTVEQRKELSTRVKIPDDKTSDEDRAKFWRAVGVPPAAKDYEVALPEGMELSETESAMLEAIREKALDGKITKDGFKLLTETYFGMQKASEDAINSELKSFAERSQAQLKKEYGGELDGALNAANDLIAKLNVPDFEWLLKQPITLGKATVQLGNHPGMMQLLAKLGKRGGEAQPGGLNLMVTATDKDNARKRINEIRLANPPGSESYKSKVVQDELNSLYELID